MEPINKVIKVKKMGNKAYISYKGFTLIEIMIAIAIMAIIAGIAIPNYIEWSMGARLRSAVNDLSSDLAMARLRAIKSSAKVGVIFAADGYQVFIDDNDNNTLDSGEVILRSKQYPAGVSMSGTTFASSRALFHRTGASSAGTVMLSRGGNQQINIVVNAVGRIRVETL